ncbi:beta-galactosidase [Actinoplanes sp. NPDC051343]|uniref:beta-galactosidase n=1 Tax=Actinoplanes sp. NPDC051343 TaxID=3363906 RepID=UPI0037BDEBB5
MLLARHQPWATPLRRPSMGNDSRPGVALTSRALWRDGAPVIPVSGELHYSRVPRSRWQTRLRQMRAGGVTVVASYVFWLHHVPARDVVSFDGNLDVATFADLCDAEGLDLILRIGPWCHGETRNGGFPDWVQHASVGHRTDDPGYLELVREWFGQLGRHLDGRSLFGIQLENELYDQPGHLDTLQSIARDAGLSAPLWMATAWGSASLPATSVLPLYGGYGDGFWVDADAPWDPTFRAHYFFSHVWDDPGIGADLRRDRPVAAPSALSALFPPATAELGGGMATAYHRRPRPTALDVATVAHCKIGNGSAWQGYYMYAGGTNPPGTQESHETGYPNDLQRLGYDFHAPIGESGVLAPSHSLLRRQHALLAAFGASLTEMPSSLPAVLPSGVEDTHTLRWAVRSDGVSGFLFIAWHQPHVPLRAFHGAQFEVALDDDSLVLPSAPVDIPAGTLACWPLRLTLGGVRLDWITASALTVLPGPTLVVTAAAGVPVEYAIDGVAHRVTPTREPVRVGDLDLLVLPAGDADLAWVCSDGPAGRRLLLSSSELTWGPSGQISSAGPDVLVYDPDSRGFSPLALDPADAHPLNGQGSIAVERAGGRAVPVSYGKFDGRESAPGPEVFDELAAVYRVELPGWAADPAHDALLFIGWAGDVGELRVDGRTVTDRFWDGSEWVVNLRDAGYRAGARLSLHLLPLAAGSPVWLPDDARERLLGSDGQLLALDHVRVAGRVRLEETS